jgi:hypothetical protein
MSNQNHKNRAEEPSYPGFEDRVTFNPAAEDSSDSVKKIIGDIRNGQFEKIAPILPQAMPLAEDDDEDIPTGVKDWNVPKTILALNEPGLMEADDGYEIVSEDEISIGDLPEDVQEELEIDQVLNNLGKAENQFSEENALYAEEDSYSDEDSGPSARIFNVGGLDIAELAQNLTEDNQKSGEVKLPQNETVAPPANMIAENLYKFLDRVEEDLTLNLSEYSELLWEFIESAEGKIYQEAITNYSRNVTSYAGIKTRSKEPRKPPNIEIYLKRFLESKKRRKK